MKIKSTIHILFGAALLVDVSRHKSWQSPMSKEDIEMDYKLAPNNYNQGVKK